MSSEGPAQFSGENSRDPGDKHRHGRRHLDHERRHDVFRNVKTTVNISHKAMLIGHFRR